jgi:regulator of protease activity HflC (stomatin/prohibitin superfamily)
MSSERRPVYLVGAVVLLGFFILLFWRLIFVSIPAGHAGVRYDLFLGTRFGRVVSEGLAVKLPWNRIYVYDLRLHTTEQTVRALSREGMNVDVEIALLFRPDVARLPELHTQIGPAYVERVVVPLSIGAVRQYISQHDSHELYTVDAAALHSEIVGGTRAELAAKHVVLHDVIMKRLSLPTHVVAAIEEKLTQQQRAASYEFRLETEAAEAERLRIKGVGLQRYYAAVERALTPSLLTWRGMEATMELAQSDNSKVVIVGSGKHQLPLILGSDISLQGDGKPAPSPPARRAP